MNQLVKKIYLFSFLIIVLILPSAVYAVVIPISDWNDLLGVQNDLAGDYILVNDLDQNSAGYSTVAGTTANGDFGFISISDGITGLPFTGSFDGDGFSIKDIVIKNQAYNGNGLFAEISATGEVFDLNIENMSISNTAGKVGVLAGSNAGTITNVHVTLSDIPNIAASMIGGLVGETTSTSVIVNSTTNIDIDGSGTNGGTGGLVGENAGNITNSHAYGTVIGAPFVSTGGLLGSHTTGTVTNSSATGSISGSTANAGGLVGGIGSGIITNSFASGNVSNTENSSSTGGLVGSATGGSITDSYATGNVSSVGGDGLGIGGLVGLLQGATVTNTFATGLIEQDTDFGGVFGTDNGGSTINFSFYDTQTSGLGANSCSGIGAVQSDLAGCIGKTTLQMKDVDTFTTDLGVNAWDFVTDWDINATDNSGYPHLAWQVFPDVTAPTVDTLSPLDNATDVATDTNLVITFSEAVDVETGNITIKETADDSTFATIDVTGGLVTGTGTTTTTINPATNLSSETEYYVLIDVTAFDDAAGNSYAGIASTTAWSFTTADEVSPVISETTPVTASGTDTTPDYTFTSDEAGDITYGGSCTSATTTAIIGANTITFSTLALGTFTDCTITVTDDALNASNVVAVTSFTIVAPASGSSYGSRAIKKVIVASGYPSAPTIIPTDCLPSYVFSPSTGILCPKDIPNKFIFLNNLYSGVTHLDVKELQKYLNTHGFVLALSGPGSLGNEINNFGPLTKQALIKFQQAKNITPAIGYFGPITRGVMNGIN